MIRHVDIDKISDGRLYDLQDMARLGCHQCQGCSQCCRDMEALLLDPLDIYRLCQGLNRSFEDMLEDEIFLIQADQVILPTLNMETKDGACVFLNEEGRCSIHPHRPGICRLFPLGRIYENGNYSYFLQDKECPHPDKYKVRIRQWLDTPEPERVHNFVLLWHDFIRDTGELMPKLTEASRQQALTYIIKVFYLAPYHSGDFFSQFEQRLKKAKTAFHMI